VRTKYEPNLPPRSRQRQGYSSVPLTPSWQLSGRVSWHKKNGSHMCGIGRGRTMESVGGAGTTSRALHRAHSRHRGEDGPIIVGGIHERSWNKGPFYSPKLGFFLLSTVSGWEPRASSLERHLAISRVSRLRRHFSHNSPHCHRLSIVRPNCPLAPLCAPEQFRDLMESIYKIHWRAAAGRRPTTEMPYIQSRNEFTSEFADSLPL
jgi:hypothetical protein